MAVFCVLATERRLLAEMVVTLPCKQVAGCVLSDFKTQLKPLYPATLLLGEFLWHLKLGKNQQIQAAEVAAFDQLDDWRQIGHFKPSLFWAIFWKAAKQTLIHGCWLLKRY
jgi:hypothetical protein